MLLKMLVVDSLVSKCLYILMHNLVALLCLIHGWMAYFDHWGLNMFMPS
jgi:hypothetical protein